MGAESPRRQDRPKRRSAALEASALVPGDELLVTGNAERIRRRRVEVTGATPGRSRSSGRGGSPVEFETGATVGRPVEERVAEKAFDQWRETVRSIPDRKGVAPAMTDTFPFGQSIGNSHATI